MAEKIFTEEFCEIQKRNVCTTTEDLRFDNFTDCGTYHIYEDKGDGCNCTYYLFVDKSANGQTTQTRVHCGKVEYRKQNEDGTWTAWSNTTGGDVPENVCTWGGYVDNLPENPTAGTMCILKSDIATNAYKFSGLVDELFDCWEEAGETWIVRPLFDVPAECIVNRDIGYGEEPVVMICRDNGAQVNTIHAAEPLGYPFHIYPSDLGASDRTEVVTVYVPIVLKGIYPKIKLIRGGSLVVYDGRQWNSYPSTQYIGDIDAALDAILAMDAQLLGGDA